MTTTELITPPRAPSSPEHWSDARRNAHLAASASPSFGEMLAETLPLIGFVPVAGPPVVLVAGPWLFLALLVAGPFVLLLTTAGLLMAVAALVGLMREILVALFALFRDRGRHRAAHRPMRAPAGRLLAGASR